MMNHRQTLRMYEEWATLADLREGDRYLMINPYFHTFGLKAGLIASFLRGATMLPVAVFDIDRVVELIEPERITMLPGPPTLYHSLLAVADKGKLATLRAGVTGAADIPVELVRRIHDELPFQTLMTGYGLTEAGNVTLSRPGDSFEDVATTAGSRAKTSRCASPTTARCWCVATASCRATSTIPPPPPRRSTPTVGCTPATSAASPTAGRLRIVGRKKDMFIVGGFNAYPAEIEGFLLEHPAVAQAAVIGVPDERLGQVGKAFIVVKDGNDGRQRRRADRMEPRADGRISRCRGIVEFLDELPLNATGKVMKDRLR